MLSGFPCPWCDYADRADELDPAERVRERGRTLIVVQCGRCRCPYIADLPG